MITHDKSVCSKHDAGQVTGQLSLASDGTMQWLGRPAVGFAALGMFRHSRLNQPPGPRPILDVSPVPRACLARRPAVSGESRPVTSQAGAGSMDWCAEYRISPHRQRPLIPRGGLFGSAECT